MTFLFGIATGALLMIGVAFIYGSKRSDDF